MNSLEQVDFLCFGGEDWWYHNRAHTDMQLMRQFAENGIILYVNSIVAQRPRIGQSGAIVKKVIRKTKSILRGLQKSDEGFWVYSPFSLPVQHVGWLRPVNEAIIKRQIRSASKTIGLQRPVVWVVCPTACDIALWLKSRKLVYQRTDRFENFPNVNAEQISRFDAKLKAGADLTIFASKSLYQSEAGQCRKAVYVDHGVDFEMFASAERCSIVPADMEDIRRPIAGYFGAIDKHKLDIKLMEQVVDSMPDISFVFVGSVSVDCSGLNKRENFRLLGQKEYEQIPHYGKMFDVAIIPWKKSAWTAAANPIKLKEYLALGKPIVTTPAFAELCQYEDVAYVASDAEQFAQSIRRALTENCKARIAARRRKVKGACWANKAQLILGKLFEMGPAGPQLNEVSVGGANK